MNVYNRTNYNALDQLSLVRTNTVSTAHVWRASSGSPSTVPLAPADIVLPIRHTQPHPLIGCQRPHTHSQQHRHCSFCANFLSRVIRVVAGRALLRHRLLGPAHLFPLEQTQQSTARAYVSGQQPEQNVCQRPTAKPLEVSE